ncbi:MAG: hypothetical protein WBG76_16755 [Ornithinimicrobium sp.]
MKSGIQSTMTSLANTAKHAAAHQGWIQLTRRGGVLLVVVGDDGVGGANPDRGSGMRGVQRRLGVFDGTMWIHSPPGGPTLVTMEVPCVLSAPKTMSSFGTGWSG